MSATAIRKKGAASFEELKPACQILILHEDFSAYTRAVEVCRRVMEQFASELDFDVKCWNFIELGDPNCARHAAKTAGVADIILLSLQTPRLAAELDRWLDAFPAVRFNDEGALALVLSNVGGSPEALEKLLLRMEQLAGRLGMDFVPLFLGHEAAVVDVPPVEAPPPEIPDRPAFDHWGLNE